MKFKTIYWPIVEALRERFWDLVFPEPNTGCWLWGGPENGYGYGRLFLHKRAFAAHRLSLEIAGVRLKPEDVVCHRCNNPGCVNPVHLYVGTHSDNMQQAQKQGRTAGFLNEQRKVKQFTLDGHEVAEYDSVMEAVRKNSFHQGNISSVCRGERPHAHGYFGKYDTSSNPT